MFSQATQFYKTVLKTSMLLCVYSLHLLFFQAAMASSPEYGAGKYLKTYLSRKADANKGKPSPASFYVNFVKQNTVSVRLTIPFPDVVLSSISGNHLQVVINELVPVSDWLTHSHLPDDAFKIYQRNSAFLI